MRLGPFVGHLCAAALAALAALAAGCGRPSRARDARELALAARATGVWDATFRLERTPRGRAPEHAPAARGTVALVETRSGVGREWLHAAPTHTGVYAIEFGPLGFVPETSGPVPVLVATVATPDTLVAATPAGAEGGSLVARGTVSADGDSVAGTWSYATRAVGGWGGTFTLSRRRVAGR